MESTLSPGGGGQILASHFGENMKRTREKGRKCKRKWKKEKGKERDGKKGNVKKKVK